MTFTLDRRHLLASSGAAFLLACNSRGKAMTEASNPTLGTIERYSSELDALIDIQSPIELLADGFRWSEGPTWDARRGRLLFSDIPNNRIHIWTEADGLGVFLDPAGDPHDEVDEHAAPGTNGLFYESGTDTILICNQDGRSIDRLDLEGGEREQLVSRYDGAKFNSPNDVVRSSDGAIWFTDPPYGLKEGGDSAGREMETRGVYRLSPTGTLDQLVSDMTLPNGLALSPDEQYLYVSQSDPADPILRRFAVGTDGQLSGGEVWLDTKSELTENNPGLPDGMALDTNGNVWTTGPGGVWIVTPSGDVLGRIHTGKATANCAFGDDGRTLYMTANDTLLRVRTSAMGAFFA